MTWNAITNNKIVDFAHLRWCTPRNCTENQRPRNTSPIDEMLFVGVQTEELAVLVHKGWRANEQKVRRIVIQIL